MTEETPNPTTKTQSPKRTWVHILQHVCYTNITKSNNET
jgi:hypothetical protein